MEENRQEQAVQTAPVLTFGEPVPAAQTPDKSADLAKQAEKVSENVLSPEEVKQAEEFAGKIDLANSEAILSYGAGTQKKMADFSEKTLDSVRTKDMGEVGGMITDLIVQLKNFDVDSEEKGLKGLFRKGRNKAEVLKTNYAKVETNVEVISGELEKHQQTLLKDIAMLDQMYDLNLNYFKELSMYILAGKKKLEEVREGQLKDLQEKAQKSGLPEDAQAAKDLAAQCERFEKKLYDLELTRTIALQTAPQIRMVQSSDTMMAEKIQTTLVNTIPLWKSQMVIALGVEHSNQAAAAQRAVSEMTNELLKKNAEKLKMSAVESAKESERGIVDIETLKATNEQLISTLDEVAAIQKEGRQKRQAAEAELTGIEDELKKKLLEMSHNA
ncbi:MAG: toxic anion resistance protein [Lachnospiraceae bacterium]|jgi:uncharacterized protein YaaN involved in tellurite resistance|nr:toxic anion resistance protein [Lachnospiraceae bacterium]MCH4031687.1 toxic anion resistance protein [Lachnospiraceae bacterium]MCH4069908.1 toxic anion resistance protein [Lachnospiraceae bacterium]MCH4108241.1 toxic anion resistance protein [Lachnospiraceae bacterium]MCI1303056.1 toxic anion resistance protein [Lachnospiraceae bacterium]